MIAGDLAGAAQMRIAFLDIMGAGGTHLRLFRGGYPLRVSIGMRGGSVTPATPPIIALSIVVQYGP